LDPQANATSGLGIDVSQNTPTTYELLAEKSTPIECLQKTRFEFLEVIPSDTRLAGAEIELVNAISREYRLKNVIAEALADFCFVLMDCPPSLGLITLNGLTTADSLIVPLQCEFFALAGLGKLRETLKLVEKHLNADIDIEGILLTMYDPRLRICRQVEEEARRHFGSLVFKTCVRRNVKLSEAPSHGKAAIEYDILSQGAQDYLTLAAELLA